jgi:hypothetical protein
VAVRYVAFPVVSSSTDRPGLLGRVIGLVTAVKTGGTLLGALAAPVLYTINPITAFGTTSLVLMAGATALGICLAIDHRRRPPAPPQPPEPAREGVPAH